jgi:hypothetical protein
MQIYLSLTRVTLLALAIVANIHKSHCLEFGINNPKLMTYCFDTQVDRQPLRKFETRTKKELTKKSVQQHNGTRNWARCTRARRLKLFMIYDKAVKLSCLERFLLSCTALFVLTICSFSSSCLQLNVEKRVVKSLIK